MPRDRPRGKGLLLPLALFVVVSGIVFGLAKAQPFEKDTGAGQAIVLGDAAAGQVVYGTNCATCHGQQAEGGVGPTLKANAISLEAARGVIRAGRGIMPAGLVAGKDEENLLAYLKTILATP